MRIVEQDPHQLRHRHRRVRIVQLNRDFVRECVPIGIAATEAPHQIGQRAGYQKILLNKAQCLSHAGGVVGIQHPSQGFGCESAGQRSDEIAAAECLKVEIVGGGGGPRRSVLMLLPPYPITGRSNGIPINAEGRPGTGRNCPPTIAKEQLSLTSTVSLRRGTSQGSFRPSQLSGCSCCQPPWMVCLKMPYS